MIHLTKPTLILSIFLILTFTIQAQEHPTCDGTRYLEDITTDLTVTTGVKFGENTTIGGNFRELLMDVYEPANDEAATRPAIVFAFGGGFVSGNRQSMSWLCEIFARKGYVAATIDYRLVDAFITDTFQLADVVMKATVDMKAAVRYLREDAATNNLFRVDTNLVFAGGISAGAITAVHTAYLDENDEIPEYIMEFIEDNGGFEGNSSANYEYSSSVQGVLNYSGALKEAMWMDADEAPIFSAHDDMDPVVPYGNEFFDTGFPGLITYLEGSGSMAVIADNIGLTNELITVPNSDGHVSFFGGNAATYQADVLASSVILLYNIVCDAMLSDTEDLEEEFATTLSLYPNPVATDLTIELAKVPVEFDLMIYDLMGKKVLEQQNLKIPKILIPVQHLANGFYSVQLRFRDDFGTVIQKKMMIQR